MPVIVKKIEKNLDKVTILIIYSLVAFYFVVNGEGIFTAWGTGWTYSALIYLTGVALFLGVKEELPEELESSLTKNVLGFLIASLFTLFLLLIVRDFGLFFRGINPMPYHLIPSNLAYQLVIVSSSEEIIFRGVIFGYLYDHFKLRPQKQSGEIKRYGWVIPYLGSSAIFSVYHLMVYKSEPLTLVLIFCMGIIFAYAVERLGLGASIGAHWIWNSIAMGIFYF